MNKDRKVKQIAVDCHGKFSKVSARDKKGRIVSTLTLHPLLLLRRRV